MSGSQNICSSIFDAQCRRFVSNVFCFLFNLREIKKGCMFTYSGYLYLVFYKKCTFFFRVRNSSSLILDDEPFLTLLPYLTVYPIVLTSSNIHRHLLDITLFKRNRFILS